MISVNRKFFPYPCILRPALTGFRLELGIGARSPKTRMMGLPDGQKDRLRRLDTIPACDGQTDRRTDTARQQRPRYAERRAGIDCLKTTSRKDSVSRLNTTSQIQCVLEIFSVLTTQQTTASSLQWRIVQQLFVLTCSSQTLDTST